jgi:hypothetical protein
MKEEFNKFHTHKMVLIAIQAGHSPWLKFNTLNIALITVKDIPLSMVEILLLNGQKWDIIATVLHKREIILQILNGAQMRVIEKFFRTDKHQPLFILNQTSTARTPTMQTSIFQLQLEILPHHFQNRFGLNLRITHQIYNGAQMEMTDKFFKMDKLQQLFIQMQDSIVKILTIQTIIFQLQSEISHHHYPNRFGLNLRVQLMELLTLLKKDQMVLHFLALNGAQMVMTDKFYSTEELLLFNIQTLVSIAKILNMKVNSLQFENFVKLKMKN